MRARCHLFMKTMQQQSYPENLKFLLDPLGRTVSLLVWNVDLFIDGERLIKSYGRISKSLQHGG